MLELSERASFDICTYLHNEACREGDMHGFGNALHRRYNRREVKSEGYVLYDWYGRTRLGSDVQRELRYCIGNMREYVCMYICTAILLSV